MLSVFDYAAVISPDLGFSVHIIKAVKNQYLYAVQFPVI